MKLSAKEKAQYIKLRNQGLSLEDISREMIIRKEKLINNFSAEVEKKNINFQISKLESLFKECSDNVKRESEEIINALDKNIKLINSGRIKIVNHEMSLIDENDNLISKLEDLLSKLRYWHDEKEHDTGYDRKEQNIYFDMNKYDGYCGCYHTFYITLPNLFEQY